MPCFAGSREKGFVSPLIVPERVASSRFLECRLRVFRWFQVVLREFTWPDQRGYKRLHDAPDEHISGPNTPQ